MFFFLLFKRDFSYFSLWKSTSSQSGVDLEQILVGVDLEQILVGGGLEQCEKGADKPNHGEVGRPKVPRIL